MAVSPPLFLAELSEQDRAHFRNLALIRPQLPSESQLSLVESLARTLGCRRLLTVIARTPHWLVHGPILEALAENEATPEPIRRDLEMAVSLVDLMREMDRAPAGEKDERAEMAKAVYAQLPAAMKPVVKQQLKALARGSSAAQTPLGQWLYGGLTGMLCILIRVANPAFPEGVMLAILLGNVCAPLFDYFVIQANIRRRKLRHG